MMSREQCTANQRPVFRLHGDYVTVLFPHIPPANQRPVFGSREQCTANQRPVIRLHGDHMTVLFPHIPPAYQRPVFGIT